MIVCSEKELRPHTRHADTHTAHAVSEWGVVRGCWGGQSFSRANQIQWRQRQSRLPACPSASQPACLLSAIFRSSVQLSSWIQIPARDTDIYNCHSCLPKCETPAEQPNDFLFLGSGFKLLPLFALFWLVQHQHYVQFYVIFSEYVFFESWSLLISSWYIAWGKSKWSGLFSAMEDSRCC